MKPINTLCGQNVEFVNVKPGGKNSNHCATKGYISVIKTSQLILGRKIIAVRSEIETKHINTLCGQNVEFFDIKLVVHIITTGL